MSLRHLYIGEVGYGNLGDDTCAMLMQSAMGGDMEIRSFRDASVGEQIDTLIVGGGTLLDCRGSAWMRRLAALSLEAKETVLAGTGLDPGDPWSSEGIAILGALLVGTNEGRRLVRGPLSVALIKTATGIDCQIGLDPMVLFEPRLEPRQGECILIVPGYQAKTVAGVLFHEQLIAVARQLLAMNWEVQFLPVWHRDLDLALFYSHEVGNGNLATNQINLEYIAGAITDSYAVITNRLHAGLLALLLGRPALFLAHHIKAVDLCLALGWPHYVTPNGDTWGTTAVKFVEHSEPLPMGKLAQYRKRFRAFTRSLRHD